MNPGGTGRPARASSPRLAPLPPARSTSALPTSANQTTGFIEYWEESVIRTCRGNYSETLAQGKRQIVGCVCRFILRYLRMSGMERLLDRDGLGQVAGLV